MTIDDDACAGIRPKTVRARAILFDLDGTLVDSTPAVVRSWNTWAREEGLSGFHLSEHGRPARDVVAEHVPLPRVPAALDRIHRLECSDVADIVALPGAHALLSALPRSAWAIVTSGSDALARARIAAAGLSVPDVFVTSDEPIPGKPAPDPYLLAAARLGLDPEDCVVIEDAPAGLAAAAAAGMRAIAVTSTAPRDRLQPSALVVADLGAIDLTIAADGTLLLVARESGSSATARRD